MDTRFLALIAATFVTAFVVFWMWFAPAVPAAAPVALTPTAQATDPAPVAASSPPPAQDPPPPPPSYQPPPDPTVVHRLG